MDLTCCDNQNFYVDIPLHYMDNCDDYIEQLPPVWSVTYVTDLRLSVCVCCHCYLMTDIILTNDDINLRTYTPLGLD